MQNSKTVQIKGRKLSQTLQLGCECPLIESILSNNVTYVWDFACITLQNVTCIKYQSFVKVQRTSTSSSQYKSKSFLQLNVPIKPLRD